MRKLEKTPAVSGWCLALPHRVWVAQVDTRWCVTSLWWQGISGTLSPAARALCWPQGGHQNWGSSSWYQPKAELVELAGCRHRSFAASLCWKSFSSWEKFSEPINWYLSVSHVCGGVNKSQQLSFVVAPSAIPPQIIQENLKNCGKDVKKVTTPFRK